MRVSLSLALAFAFSVNALDKPTVSLRPDAVISPAATGKEVAPALRGKTIADKTDDSEGLEGQALYDGIKAIIGADPNVPKDQVDYKPFMGSFSTIKSTYDADFASTGYCMTDNACGHWDAYSSTSVPLSDLSCNKFCFIDKWSKKYVPTYRYTVQNPPKSWMCCGWETC